MTNDFTLNDTKTDRLLRLLEKNEEAVEQALRWTPETAEQIAEMKTEIAEQIE